MATRRSIVRPTLTPQDPGRDRRLAALRAHLNMAMTDQERWTTRMVRAFNHQNKLRTKIKRLLKQIAQLEGGPS